MDLKSVLVLVFIVSFLWVKLDGCAALKKVNLQQEDSVREIEFDVETPTDPEEEEELECIDCNTFNVLADPKCHKPLETNNKYSRLCDASLPPHEDHDESEEEHAEEVCATIWALDGSGRTSRSCLRSPHVIQNTRDASGNKLKAQETGCIEGEWRTQNYGPYSKAKFCFCDEKNCNTIETPALATSLRSKLYWLTVILTVFVAGF